MRIILKCNNDPRYHFEALLWLLVKNNQQVSRHWSVDNGGPGMKMRRLSNVANFQHCYASFSSSSVQCFLKKIVYNSQLFFSDKSLKSFAIQWLYIRYNVSYSETPSRLMFYYECQPIRYTEQNIQYKQPCTPSNILTPASSIQKLLTTSFSPLDQLLQLILIFILVSSLI